MMPQAGFEPVHCCQYSDLNAARLPVPPLGQLSFNNSFNYSEKRAKNKPFSIFMQLTYFLPGLANCLRKSVSNNAARNLALTSARVGNVSAGCFPLVDLVLSAILSDLL